jgi:hypothetical protein
MFCELSSTGAVYCSLISGKLEMFAGTGLHDGNGLKKKKNATDTMKQIKLMEDIRLSAPLMKEKAAMINCKSSIATRTILTASACIC